MQQCRDLGLRQFARQRRLAQQQRWLAALQRRHRRGRDARVRADIAAQRQPRLRHHHRGLWRRTVEQFHQPHREQRQRQRDADADAGITRVQRPERLARRRCRFDHLDAGRTRLFARLHAQQALLCRALHAFELVQLGLHCLVLIEAGGECADRAAIAVDLPAQHVGRVARARQLPFRLDQRHFLAGGAFAHDLLLDAGKPFARGARIRVERHVRRRKTPFHVAQRFSQRRRAMLQRSQRRVVLVTRYTGAGSSRIAQRAQPCLRGDHLVVRLVEQHPLPLDARQDVVLVAFRRDDVVTDAKRLDRGAPGPDRVGLQPRLVAQFVQRLRGGALERGRLADAIDADQAVEQLRQGFGLRPDGGKFQQVGVRNRHDQQARLQRTDRVGAEILGDAAGARQFRPHLLHQRPAGEHMRLDLHRPRAGRRGRGGRGICLGRDGGRRGHVFGRRDDYPRDRAILRRAQQRKCQPDNAGGRKHAAENLQPATIGARRGRCRGLLRGIAGDAEFRSKHVHGNLHEASMVVARTGNLRPDDEGVLRVEFLL